MSRVRHVKAGEWVAVEIGDRLALQCCDCTLVHDIVIRRAPGGIEIAFWRNNRKTSARRRAQKTSRRKI